MPYGRQEEYSLGRWTQENHMPEGQMCLEGDIDKQLFQINNSTDIFSDLLQDNGNLC